MLTELQILGILDNISDIVDGDEDQKRLQAMQIISAISKRYKVEVKIPCPKCGEEDISFCRCNEEHFWYDR